MKTSSIPPTCLPMRKQGLGTWGMRSAECEAVRMRINTPKSEAIFLNWEKVECLLWVREEIQPQVEEFKYLGLLFTSGGKMEQEVEKRIGANDRHLK